MASKNPWAMMSSQQADPNDLDALLAQIPGAGGQDPAASTPATNAMAAMQNPMPGVGQGPGAQPTPGGASVFHLAGRNQLPDDAAFGQQIQALLKQSKDSDNQSFTAQKTGLQNYSDQIQKTLNATQSGVDLTPLAALADSWKRGGGHLADSYKAPMSPQDKAALAAKLQDELLKRTQDLTKDERDSLKDRLSTTLGIAKLSKDTSIANQLRMQAADANYLQKGQQNLNADKGYVKAQGTLDEVNTVGKQLDAALQNPVAAAATPIALARLMTGGQRLNEVEINALGGAPGIMNKLQQISQTMQNGTLTPQNHKFMLDLANTLKKSAEENSIDIEQRHAKQYAKLTNSDPDNAYLSLTGKTPEDLEAIQAKQWVKANPKADPAQIAAIKAHYGF